jgi:hypothetical protein
MRPAATPRVSAAAESWWTAVGVTVSVMVSVARLSISLGQTNYTDLI